MRIMAKKYHQSQHLEKTFLVIQLASNFFGGGGGGDFVLIPVRVSIMNIVNIATGFIW